MRRNPGTFVRMKQIRLEVAAEAARILATEGQHNYHAAKRKAAERIGVSERAALPSNLEVMDALSSYQALYGGPAHRDNIDMLRRTAARAMRRLERFRPRLVGSVLDGTANAHSRVALHVFADSVEIRRPLFSRAQRAFRPGAAANPLVQRGAPHGAADRLRTGWRGNRADGFRHGPPAAIAAEPDRRQAAAARQPRRGRIPAGRTNG
jgi:hypothetical protein